MTSDSTHELEARRRVLAEIGTNGVSSREIAARLAVSGQGSLDAPASEEEAPLLPALHRLEADGALRAGWEANSAGKVRRRYRIRQRGG